MCLWPCCKMTHTVLAADLATRQWKKDFHDGFGTVGGNPAFAIAVGASGRTAVMAVPFSGVNHLRVYDEGALAWGAYNTTELGIFSISASNIAFSVRVCDDDSVMAMANGSGARLARYAADGTLSWHIATPFNARSLAVDSAGNAYGMWGISSGSSTQDGMYVEKKSVTDGSRVWVSSRVVTRHIHAGNMLKCKDVGGTECLYAGCQINDGSEKRGFVKLDTAGGIVGTVTPLSGHYVFGAYRTTMPIAVDSAGDVYLYTDASTQYAGTRLVKITAGGSVAWSTVLPQTVSGGVWNLECDDSDNVYVFSEQMNDGAGVYQGRVDKYDSGGTWQAAHRWGSAHGHQIWHGDVRGTRVAIAGETVDVSAAV